MNNAERLKLLHTTGKTVFTAKHLRGIWKLNDKGFMVTIKRVVDSKLLIRLAKGLYALSEHFNPLELANTLVTPSYISFHTALVHHGIAFQADQRIISAAPFPYTRTILNTIYLYQRIKKDILYDPEGIKAEGTIAIASSERAILDSLYAGIKPNIDNPDKLNKHLLKELSRLYPKRVQKAILNLI